MAGTGDEDGGGKKSGRRPRGAGRRGSPPTVEKAARDAVQALQALGRALAGERGFAEREVLPVEAVELPVRVPLQHARDRRGREAAAALQRELDRRLSEALRGAGAFEQGGVYCFLCDAPDCRHAAPPDAISVFAGYAAHGKPEWIGFPNLLLARGDDRVDRLYGAPPEILALSQSAAELAEDLLPDFGRDDRSWSILGQVVAGLVPADLGATSAPVERVALSFQLVETRGGQGGRRLRLNVLGLSRAEIAEAAAMGHARGPGEALRRTLRKTRQRLDSLGRRSALARRQGQPLDLEAEAAALLGHLRGDVERVFRAARRRTRHAQDRHEMGERPTGHAMVDVSQASDDQLFHDTRRDTVVVVGSRGRAHVFSKGGRLVTSLRLQSGELDRKVGQGRWRPLDREGALAFRRSLAE